MGGRRFFSLCVVLTVCDATENSTQNNSTGEKVVVSPVVVKAFPSDIAGKVKNASLQIPRHVISENAGDAATSLSSKYAAEDSMNALRKLSVNFLSPETISDFESLANASAKCALLAGLDACDSYNLDASHCTELQHARNAWQSHELLDATLRTLVQAMTGAAACWALAIQRKDKTLISVEEVYFNHLAEKTSGIARMIHIDFHKEQAKVTAMTTKVVSEQELENDTREPQEMEFSIAYTEGRTRSWSHSVSFSVSTDNEFLAGFLGNAKGSSVEFEVEYEGEWAGEKKREVERTYTYTMTVPPHTRYRGKALVREANMDVPYTMTVDIGGTIYAFNGIWKGVAVSDSTFQVLDVSDKPVLLYEIHEADDKIAKQRSLGHLTVLFIIGCSFAASVTFAAVVIKHSRERVITQPPLLGA